MAHWYKDYSSSSETWYLTIAAGGGRLSATVYQETLEVWRVSFCHYELSGNHCWATREEAQRKAVDSLLKMLKRGEEELVVLVQEQDK